MIARRRVNSLDDAEDCVQDALMRAATFRGLDENRVGQFLTTTVMRLCADVHRARARGDRARARLPRPIEESGPEARVCDQAEGEWLLSLVDGLTGRQRQVLLARAGGLTTREAGAALAVSAKTAETAFTRGRAYLLERARRELSASAGPD